MSEWDELAYDQNNYISYFNSNIEREQHITIVEAGTSVSRRCLENPVTIADRLL